MIGHIKYFVGNWKMFGIPRSIKIIDRINGFFNKDKKNNKRYKIAIAPPHTLIQDFSNKYKNKKIIISAQNCYHKDSFGAHTGQISPFMIKNIGIKFIIIGHSENRASGETDKIIQEKIQFTLKNNFKVFLCIGENSTEKRKKKTFTVLKNQLKSALSKRYNFNNIIIAYEPVWSIGTGKILSTNELKKIIIFLKKFIKNHFKKKTHIKILYGGSVDKKSIYKFKSIKELDGFLIGSASKSSKNFIDIIKNFYK